jgi:hypothetical protein
MQQKNYLRLHRIPHSRMIAFRIFDPLSARVFGAVSSLFVIPTHSPPEFWGGFLTFCNSDPLSALVLGRFPHFLQFRPTLRRIFGAVSSLFVIPTHSPPSFWGGFLTFCIFAPDAASIPGQCARFLTLSDIDFGQTG